MSFSPAYHRALKEAQDHHLSSKTYSGKFLRTHAPAIRALIDEHGAGTLLDYGCGKGRQYEWVSHGEDASIPKGMTIEQYWGIPVTKFDPAYPPFATRPKSIFDLTICTHVLGSVPVADLETVFLDLVSYTTGAIYIAEKIGPVRKQVFSAPETMPRWTRAQWYAHLQLYMAAASSNARFTGLPQVWLATRERTERGVLTQLEQVK